MAKRRRISALVSRVVLAVVIYLAAPCTQAVRAGKTTRVSTSSAGEEANRYCTSPSVSLNGRYVAFETQADNLVPDDTNAKTDILVHDLWTGETTRVSVSSDGEPGDGHSYSPAISADGRYIAFHSEAGNLVPDDTNRWCDVFVHDLYTGRTERVSIPATGGEADRLSSSPTISADGRYVAFCSLATNMVLEDTNQKADIFVRDREMLTTRRISVSSDGDQSNGLSASPSISSDGRYIAFQSYATNLVEDDTNGHADIFVHDGISYATIRASMAWSGLQANGFCDHPSISGDGHYVAFHSYASNLVRNDTNDSADVFVFDLEMEEISRVSVSSAGDEGNDLSRSPSISPDGQYVAYYSAASNLVSDDTTGWLDVFVHDRRSGETVRTSFSTCRVPGDDDSDQPQLTDQGQYVVFASLATNLVPEDTNRYADIFVHEREPVCLCSEADPPRSGVITRDPDELCLPIGATVELTAHAEGACQFLGWSGGVPPGQEFNNPVSVPLAISTTVTAHFGSDWGGMDDDCDANGIPDGCDGVDCNGTGMLDMCDVLMGTSFDCNENLVPDECDAIVPGDFNSDGEVDLDDFRGFPQCLGGPWQMPYPPAPECVLPCVYGFDFDLDWDVDLSDVSAFWSAYRNP